MTYRDTLKAWLIKDEDKIPYAYQDSEGYWSIAVGRLIDKRRGGRLREDEMTLMLENDMNDAEADARSVFQTFEDLTDNRKAVLCSMAFNLGRVGLAAFKRLQAAVEAEDWTAAEAEMLASRWSLQIKGRASRLAKVMREG